MTTRITSKGTFNLYEISSGEIDVEYDFDEFTKYIYFYQDGKMVLAVTGNYTFLCTTDTITEEIAWQILDNTKMYHWVDAFELLLKQHNLSLDKTYAICKKN